MTATTHPVAPLQAGQQSTQRPPSADHELRQAQIQQLFLASRERQLRHHGAEPTAAVSLRARSVHD